MGKLFEIKYNPRFPRPVHICAVGVVLCTKQEPPPDWIDTQQTVDEAYYNLFTCRACLREIENRLRDLEERKANL